ncbi:MAG: hypothetical protein KJ062_19080 [Thermoanaerobaculia bacterium]|nr:hypothetical protein [Thermoanaerobaculia bacterium]
MKRVRRSAKPTPPPTPPDPLPAASPEAAGGPPSAEEFAALLARVAQLERDVRAGGIDRKIPLDEIAARLRHSPSRIRAWAKDPARVRQYRLDLLLVPSPLPNDDLYSTPRLLAQWEDAIRLQWQRVLFGGGRAPGEALFGERRR